MTDAERTPQECLRSNFYGVLRQCQRQDGRGGSVFQEQGHGQLGAHGYFRQMDPHV